MMSYSDDDEDLRTAIALSLEAEASVKSRNHEVIDLTSSEDEDDDLDAPVVVRKATISKPTPDFTTTDAASSDHGTTGSTTVLAAASTSVLDPLAHKEEQAAHGILGKLNRKQMEAERLARAGKQMNQVKSADQEQVSRKRKALASSSEPQDREHRQVLVKLSQERLLERKCLAAPRSSTKPLPNTASSPQPRSNAQSYLDRQESPASSVQYPRGVVKKTWVRGCARTGDDIKLEEVLQKDDLELAVLSAFQVDPDWVESKLESKSKVIWILQSKDETEVSQMVSFVYSNQ